MTSQASQPPARSHRLRPNGERLPGTFGAHVAELRRRLFFVGLFFGLGSVLAYVYRHQVLDVILRPLNHQQLVYLTPGGGFAFIFQISIYAGLILAAPALVYQLHAFIKPALPARAQRSIARVTLLATALICGGVAYGYFVAIPAAIQFLSTFAEGAVTPNLTADSYLSFFLAYVGGLALLSLTPIFLLFWHWISPMTPGGLLRSEQWIVLLAFVLAAVITPTPDVVNQAMIAGPVIAVYQLGAVAVFIDIVRRKRLAPQSAPILESADRGHADRAPVPASAVRGFQLASPVPVATTDVRQTFTTRAPGPRLSIDGVSVPTRSLSMPRRVATERSSAMAARERIRPPGTLSINGLIRQ